MTAEVLPFPEQNNVIPLHARLCLDCMDGVHGTGCECDCECESVKRLKAHFDPPVRRETFIPARPAPDLADRILNTLNQPPKGARSPLFAWEDGNDDTEPSEDERA